jgi:hypothetical protein
MDCPQCGAEVPSDDAFCGKCGYAMREGGPERVDQSRIRVHEEPASPEPTPPPGSSGKGMRQKTMLGMPSVTPRRQAPPAPPEPHAPAPPTEISAARERARKRTPQKTMLGIPRPDLRRPPGVADAEPSGDTSTEPLGPRDESAPPRRERARVRYDSMNEPFPMFDRRKKALRGLALLVILAGAWLVYRFFTANG